MLAFWLILLYSIQAICLQYQLYVNRFWIHYIFSTARFGGLLLVNDILNFLFVKRSASNHYCLVFFWTFGFIAGALFASATELDKFFWMYAIQNSRVSILSLLLVMVFPFILSLFAIRFSQCWLLLFLALVKSFVYSYCRCLIVRLFLGAGWFLNIFFFLSDSGCALILLSYWLYGLCRLGNWTLRSFYVCSFSAVLICYFHWQIITPVLSAILA